MLDFIRNVRYLHIIHVSVIIFSFIFMPSYWNGVVDSVRPTPLNKHIDIFSAHTQAHTYKRYANGCRQLADQYQRDNIENEKQTMPCHKRAAAVTPPINCYFFFIFFFCLTWKSDFVDFAHTKAHAWRINSDGNRQRRRHHRLRTNNVQTRHTMPTTLFHSHSTPSNQQLILQKHPNWILKKNILHSNIIK